MSVRAIVVAGVLLLAGAGARGADIRQQGDAWIMETPRLRVTVDPPNGAIAVLDKATKRTWAQPTGKRAAFRSVQRMGDALSFETDLGWMDNKPLPATVTLALPGNGADLAMTCDRADRTGKSVDFDFLPCFALDEPGGVLAVADYGNGHLYPLDAYPDFRTWFSTDRLDMPFVGVLDMAKGDGYALIIETSDNGAVRMLPHKVGERTVHCPSVYWQTTKGAFGYARKVLYRFIDKGSYVALAKSYREIARKQGLVVPFTEKLKKNPNIARLFGAVDAWGDATLAFAQQAKSAGVDKMLIHGRTSPADMRAINGLGYLTSEYDNYTDILPVEAGKLPTSDRGRVPEDVIQNADGSRMKAWLTYDGKLQYMKRCPTQWVAAARNVVPALLKTHPYLGRFVDVTTAEGLYECFDPAHPMDKAAKREAGGALLGFMRSQGLVVGGEHGIWWGVPHQDYIEGMMSGNIFAWPAGHLIRPKNRDEKYSGPYGTYTWEQHDKWNTGHEYRVPLWELVFHDCVVSTWYWGDANDFLMDAAPENWAKKDAFNILYGTMPMWWATHDGGWHRNRAAALRTARTVCKLHEAVATAEMVSHEFVTPDRAVQHTRFSDGTQVWANFGAKPYELRVPGQKVGHTLPTNGYYAIGPRIAMSVDAGEAGRDARPTTAVRTPDFLYTDAGGRDVSMHRLAADRVRVQVGPGRVAAVLRPSDLVDAWDLGATRVYLLNEKLERVRAVQLDRQGGALALGEALPDGAALDLLTGKAAAKADLTVSIGSRSGGALNVTVRNIGAAAANGMVSLYPDVAQTDTPLGQARVAVGAGQSRTVRVPLDASRLDGLRTITVLVRGTAAELCTANNAAAKQMAFAQSARAWTQRRRVAVEAGELTRTDEPVVVALEGEDVNGASVRVAECDVAGKPVRDVPAQMSAPDSEGRSQLVFVAQGRLAAGSSRTYEVRWAGKGSRLLPQLGTAWSGGTYTGSTYLVTFEDGAPVRICAVRDGAAQKPFIANAIYSSGETGWVTESGAMQSFRVAENGPARTVVIVRRKMDHDIAYEKRYELYPDRMCLTVTTNGRGVAHRAYYLRPGTFVDSDGNTAKVDGQGDAENVSDKAPRPLWYAVYADDWAEACVTRTPGTRITYWDSGNWGGIGFVMGSQDTVALTYVYAPGAPDARFARDAAARIATPPTVHVEDAR